MESKKLRAHLAGQYIELIWNQKNMIKIMLGYANHIETLNAQVIIDSPVSMKFKNDVELPT